MDNNSPPPRLSSTGDLPVIHAVTEAYKRWHNALPHIARLTRYSLGEHINRLFVNLLEAIFAACFASKENKAPLVQKASVTLDTLKLFLQVAWELRAIDNRTFAGLSAPLVEAGKMLGGWQKQLSRQTPPA